MNKHLIFILFLSWLVLQSCGRRYSDDQSSNSVSKENLIKASQAVVQEEVVAIDEFIKSRGWKIQKTGTGLRYEIVETGSGPTPSDGDLIRIAYKVYLLDSKLIYEVTEVNPQQSVLGRGELVNGLEEALKLMKTGTHARIVLPAHLAYGLTGDEKKIPPSTALYYDMKFLKMEDSNKK